MHLCRGYDDVHDQVFQQLILCMDHQLAWSEQQLIWAALVGHLCGRGRLLWLAGDIDYRHAFLDMSGITVAASNHTRAGTTCRAAMGFSFAAGTTDGERLNAMGWLRHPWKTSDTHLGLSTCLSHFAPAIRLQG